MLVAVAGPRLPRQDPTSHVPRIGRVVAHSWTLRAGSDRNWPGSSSLNPAPVSAEERV